MYQWKNDKRSFTLIQDTYLLENMSKNINRRIRNELILKTEAEWVFCTAKVYPLFFVTWFINQMNQMNYMIHKLWSSNFAFQSEHWHLFHAFRSIHQSLVFVHDPSKTPEPRKVISQFLRNFKNTVRLKNLWTCVTCELILLNFFFARL